MEGDLPQDLLSAPGLHVDAFLAQAAAGTPVVDVRAPCEFLAGHIPQALNIPLFDDVGRAEVGTLYKSRGRDDAVQRGLELVGPRLAALVSEGRAAAGAGRRLVVTCARGGMRSASFCWLMRMAGLDARPLVGGYKSYRHKVLHGLSADIRMVVIGGMTGSGKSETLRALAGRGVPVLDLEALAHHKGSAFGALGESPQPPNEQFENDLFQALSVFAPGATVLVEDESRSIGRISLPGEFFERLRSAPLILLDMPQKERCGRLIADYGAFPREALIASCQCLAKRLGGEKCRMACDAIMGGDLPGAVTLLLEYYDKAYARQIELRSGVRMISLAVCAQTPAATIEKIMEALAVLENSPRSQP